MPYCIFFILSKLINNVHKQQRYTSAGAEKGANEKGKGIYRNADTCDKGKKIYRKKRAYTRQGGNEKCLKKASRFYHNNQRYKSREHEK